MNIKLIFITILTIGGLIIFLSQSNRNESSTQGATTGILDTQTLSVQYKPMGAVDVEVTPISVTPNNPVVFKLSLNTHSVNLEYDYKKIATLTDEKGNTYDALEWTGEKGGHHLEGVLVFAPLPPNVETLILKLDGIDNKKESFNWSL